MSEKYFKQPSVMGAQAHFSNVPSADIQRSTFDRSHAYKTTFDAGLLIPILVDEVLPGDTFNVKSTAFARLATPLKPVMDNMYLDTHYFFVPYRLVWDNWQAFMGERKSPSDDPTLFSIPSASINLEASNIQNTIFDYMGLPKTPGPVSTEVSVLPFRAYSLIYNEWYRDENLQEPLPFETGDLNTIIFGLARRGKRKDYFTSCLPWPQKGDPVLIPLGTSAPIATLADVGDIVSVTGNDGLNRWLVNADALGQNYTTVGDDALQNQQQLYADLTEASAVSINDLRSAFQIQKLLERDARGGTRYIEIILSHFGVRSPDARLQRPEYLGGGSQYVNINPIAATFENAEVAQGQLAGVGTSVGNSGFSKSFTEHGVIIGLVSARADLTYQQGIERFWSRQTRYDFYWPALSHLGEQAVLNKEIFVQGTAEDDNVFGYQERYAEYRYKPSRITGLFSSAASASLDVWHLSQEFANLPALNASFIEDNPPIDRIVAVPDEPHFLLDVWFKMKTTRPMPVYSVPGLVDHF